MPEQTIMIHLTAAEYAIAAKIANARGTTVRRLVELNVKHSIVKTAVSRQRARAPRGAVIPTSHRSTGRRLTADEVAQIHELTAIGWAAAEIAQALDTSRITVNKYRNRSKENH